jgi:hypothetical protein
MIKPLLAIVVALWLIGWAFTAAWTPVIISR